MKRRSKQIKISIFVGCLAAGIGLIIPLVERNGDPQANIDLAQSKIDLLMSDVGKQSAFDAAWKTISPSWDDVEFSISSLTWTNRQTAEAKAMLRVPEACPPSEKYHKPCSLYDWDDRARNAARPWNIEERRDQILRAFYTSIAAFFGATVVTFIALLLVIHCWYFFLARVSELAAAVRGKF